MKEYKGITLIALIITVIVMLILAGVALSSISGDAGLFSRVQKTAELYNNSVDKEGEAINNIIEALNGNYNNDEYAKIYGVKREISNESSVWERIEDSIGLEANATHNGQPVKNDFDNIYPWSEIKTCDLKADGTVNKYYYEDGFSYEEPEGYIMTEFPEFWWKREQKDGYEYIYISGTEHEGFTKSEKFYLGRYTIGGTVNEVTTKSGVTNLTKVTLSGFREATQKIGKNWGQLDIMRWSMLQMLYLVEYADYNSQEKLGFGNALPIPYTPEQPDALLISGKCDNLKMQSGCFADDHKSAVIYRGIENIIGNIAQFCDGINFDRGQAWICNNRAEYISDKFNGSYTKLGYVCPVGGDWIKEIGYDSNNPAIQLPTKLGASDSTYTTDRMYSNSEGNYILFVGGAIDCHSSAGLYYYYSAHISSFTGWTVGGRLLYIPD